MKVRDIYKLFDEQRGKPINKTIKRFAGQFLGGGAYRDVYVFEPDHRFVLKVERDMSTGTFANVTEWRNWVNNEKWVKLAPWLAPCELITADGRILLQRRVTRKIENPTGRFPDKIPSLFTDKKYFNFGWIGKRFVCCDYSFFVQTSLRMVKVKWRDDSPTSPEDIIYRKG